MVWDDQARHHRFTKTPAHLDHPLRVHEPPGLGDRDRLAADEVGPGEGALVAFESGLYRKKTTHDDLQARFAREAAAFSAIPVLSARTSAAP